MGENKILKEGFWSFFGQFFSAIAIIAGIRVITEYVTPTHYGQYVIFASTTLLFVNVISGSFFQAFLIIIPEKANNESYDKSILLSSTIVLFCSAIGFSALLISLLFESYFLFLIFLFFVLLISEHFIGLFQTLMNIKKEQKKYAFFQILISIIKPLSAVLLYLYYENNFISILYGYIFGNLLVTFLFFPKTTIKNFIVASQQKLYLNNFSKFFEFAKPLVLQKILGWSLRNLDKFIVAFFLGTSIAGKYAPIVGLVSMMYTTASKSIELVFRPYYFEYVTSNKTRSSRKILKIYAICLLIASIGFISFFLLFNKQIVFLVLGENFREYHHLLPMFSVGFSLLIFGYLFENICYAYKKTWNIFFIEAAAAFTNIITLPIMIYNFGVKGIPFALLCTYIIHFMSGFILTKKLLKK